MIIKKYLGIAGLAVVVIVIAAAVIYEVKGSGSNSGTARPANGKVQVTASFYPMYFFAQTIGGDRAQVYNITPAGAEPHDYEPTSQDVARIENSDILVLNGGHLEPWGDKIKDTLRGSKVDIIATGDDLTNRQVNEDGQTIQDPHVWLSPPLAKEEAARILQEFIKVDPADADYFQANAAALDSKLATLDQAYHDGLQNCTEKDIVTSHAAFGYLSAAYGLNQIPITGLSPDAEPSSQDLAKVVELAKKEHISYIFFESLVSPKLSETIANEVGAQTLVLDPIEGLTDDQIAQGKDYFTQMYANLANLQLALVCQK